MKILVPTDFSNSAKIAFDFAYQLFKSTEEATFVLLNSYEKPKGSASVMMNLEQILRKDSVKELAAELKYFLNKYPGIKITTVARYGTLEESVLHTNIEEKIDFVVMGTHGATGIKKALFGSNAERAIMTMNRPIITVPRNWELRPVKKNIVYATDLKNLEKPEVLNSLRKVLTITGARIHIVYVSEHITDIDLEKEISNLPLNTYFAQHNPTFKVIENSSIANGIDEYVKEVDADMVVLIPKVASFWQKLFKRSVTEQMAFQAKIPMLTLKDA